MFNMESARWSLGSAWLRPRQTEAATPSQVQMSPLLLLQPLWDEVSVAQHLCLQHSTCVYGTARSTNECLATANSVG